MAVDLTVEILKQIRDGIGAMQAALSERLDHMDGRLEQMNGRLEQMNVRLERVEQGLNDLGGFMRDIARDHRSTSGSTDST